MEHRCNEIENNLNAFKAQYAQNGKELIKVIMSLEVLTQEVRDHHKFSEENRISRIKEEQKFKDELKPLLDSYYAIINGRRILLGLVITLSAVGSLYLLLKSIFHK